MSDRAKLLPVIATSLARMATAESPRLRQAVESLRAPTQASGIDEGSHAFQTAWDQTVTGIEKSAWEVLLSTIKPAPVARKPADGNESPASSSEARRPYHTPAPDSSSSGVEPDGRPIVVSHFGLLLGSAATPEHSGVRQSPAAYAKPHGSAGHESFSPGQSSGSSWRDSQSSLSNEPFSSPLSADYRGHHLPLDDLFPREVVGTGNSDYADLSGHREDVAYGLPSAGTHEPSAFEQRLCRVKYFPSDGVRYLAAACEQAEGGHT